MLEDMSFMYTMLCKTVPKQNSAGFSQNACDQELVILRVR